MSHHDEFRRGYIKGYQSIKGSVIPSIPPTPLIRNGENYYDVGYEMGRKAAH